MKTAKELLISISNNEKVSKIVFFYLIFVCGFLGITIWNGISDVSWSIHKGQVVSWSTDYSITYLKTGDGYTEQINDSENLVLEGYKQSLPYIYGASKPQSIENLCIFYVETLFSKSYLFPEKNISCEEVNIH